MPLLLKIPATVVLLLVGLRFTTQAWRARGGNEDVKSHLSMLAANVWIVVVAGIVFLWIFP